MPAKADPPPKSGARDDRAGMTIFCTPSQLAFTLPADWFTQQRSHASVHYLSLMRHARRTDHVVGQVDIEFSVFAEQLQKRGHVAREKLARVIRHGSREIQRGEDRDSVIGHESLIRPAEGN